MFFTCLHLAADKCFIEEIIKSGIIACETVEPDDGNRSLLTPMSGMAGRMAVHGMS